MRAKQTVIVKKTKQINTVGKAREIARQYADRIYTSRKTGSSFRFRQLPPTKFKKKSFRSKKLKGVTVVYGTLK